MTERTDANDKKKVVVNINHQDYTVISRESPEYIRRLAKYVDGDIKEILDKNNKLSNTMAAVLAAFNMTDRYYKKSEKLNELKESVLEPLKELEIVKKKLQAYENQEMDLKTRYESKTKEITEESSVKIKRLSTENETMKIELEKVKREVENLTKKNTKYKSAIEIKENDLASNQKVINDLQDKIFEHQMEVMQTKKQLEESLKRLDESK